MLFAFSIFYAIVKNCVQGELVTKYKVEIKSNDTKVLHSQL